MKVKIVLPLLLVLASCAQAPKSNEHLMMATLWMQQAGEYRALSHQAFNSGKLELDRLLTEKHKRPMAIILDVDETVLENSPYQARMILKNHEFEKGSWNAWVGERDADAMPGAVDFLQFAHKHGVEIFYVTNRPDQNNEATFDNLRRRGFPVKLSHVQTKGSDGSKEQRRLAIKSKYDVIMYFGDNLNDFDLIFYGQNNAKRRSLVDKNRKEWGTRFIVLPNPMYGDWENFYSEGESRQQRAEAREQALSAQPREQLFDKGR